MFNIFYQIITLDERDDLVEALLGNMDYAMYA